MPTFRPPQPIKWSPRGDFGHFRLRAGRIFLTLWADGGKLRGARGSRTLGMDPSWVAETSEEMVVCPYRALDPNAGPERPQLCVPVQWLRVEVSA